jgi:hypothetical protein
MMVACFTCVPPRAPKSRRDLAIDHKCLRFCDLCNELRLALNAQVGKSALYNTSFKRIMLPVPEESPTQNGSTDPQIGSSVPKLGILLLLLRRSCERTSTLRGCPAQLPNEAESLSLSGIRQGKTFSGRFSWGEAVAGSLYPDGRILHGFACASPFGNKSD